MRRVDSTRELGAVELRSRGDGFSDAYLRRNVVERVVADENGAGRREWSGEEVHFVTRLVEAEIVADFDKLWLEAEQEQTTDAEKLAKTQADLLDTQEALADMYTAILGGE